VQLDDGAIDSGSQPKIVGIENETAHGVSVSTEGPRQLSPRLRENASG
jgi:hypothetical protein